MTTSILVVFAILLIPSVAAAFAVGYTIGIKQSSVRILKIIDAATVGVDPDVRDYKKGLKKMLNE
jgi:hypothetical protein